MADALVSTPVALVADAAALTLLVVAGSKLKKNNEGRTDIVPLMGVLGAFVFAAQMLNFTIPGTGSSGHIIGGVFLAAFIGPWAAFITLASVLIVQCLLFADGGLLALGCNLINMGACSCLIAFPFIFKPLVRNGATPGRIMLASVVACIVGLEIGALLVTLETTVSGITALTPGRFLSLMCGIHLVIGAIEGVATGLILVFVRRMRPALLEPLTGVQPAGKIGWKPLAWFGGAALAIGGVLYALASSYPDGLEWSIAKLTGSPDLEAEGADAVTNTLQGVQELTAAMPDYENALSGIVGAAVVLVLIWVVCSLIRLRAVRRPVTK